MSPAQPTTHASNDAQTWSMFLVLAAIWGSSFLFIKIGLDEGIHPMTLVSLRTAFASAMLGAVLLARGGRLPLRWDIWKRMAFLGTTNIVVPFVLIAWGQQYIPSGMTSILNSTVPLFTIVLAAIALTDEHITVARLAGLGIGMGGVVLLALPSLDAAQTDDDALRALVGMSAVVLAAIFYAVAAVYTRRRLTGHAIIERAGRHLAGAVSGRDLIRQRLRGLHHHHRPGGALRAARGRPHMPFPRAAWAGWR